MGAVCYQKSGCPGFGVCTTHLESFSPLGSPLAPNVLFLGYSYLEGTYEWLRHTWFGTGRGIGDPSTF